MTSPTLSFLHWAAKPSPIFWASALEPPRSSVSWVNFLPSSLQCSAVILKLPAPGVVLLDCGCAPAPGAALPAGPGPGTAVGPPGTGTGPAAADSVPPGAAGCCPPI